MLNFKIVGCGAAGNKALANLLSIGYPSELCYFVNSTAVDIPKEYKNQSIIFGASHNRLGGCGKERNIGKKMLLEDLRNNSTIIDSIVDGNEQAIVLVGSTEGGSGSASIPILAKYFNEVYKKPVIIVLFFGFKDDIRGLQNSIEICQELSEDYTVVGIDNSSFLSEVNGNRFKAESMANDKFSLIIRILTGSLIKDGLQMIDDTDLFKIVTTPGYLIADGKTLDDRIKTAADYEKSIKDMLLSESHFIDPPKSSACKRIGCIFNLVEINDNINYSGNIIGDIYGHPYEYFISLADGCNTNDFFFIASGMKFPIDTIQNIYEQYKSRSESMDKSKDSFFDSIGSLRGNMDDSQFNMLGWTDKTNTRQNKSDFFGSFGISDFVDGEQKVTTSAIPDKEDY